MPFFLQRPRRLTFHVLAGATLACPIPIRDPPKSYWPIYRLPSEDDASPSSTAPCRMILHAPRVPSPPNAVAGPLAPAGPPREPDRRLRQLHGQVRRRETERAAPMPDSNKSSETLSIPITPSAKPSINDDALDVDHRRHRQPDAHLQRRMLKENGL